MYRTLDVRREGNLTWLVLNRPEALNALDATLIDELRDFLARLPEDRETRVVVLRGAGRAFCAGLDLKAPPAPDPGGGPNAADRVGPLLRNQRRISEIPLLMRRAPQPIVAAVHGPACGGGMALALAADLRVAGASMRMNAAFIRLGLSACDIGVSYLLPRLVGASVAAELLFTGDFIHADRALTLGLVSRVVEDDALDEAARDLAGRILRHSPLALRLTKECFQHAVDAGSLEAAIAMEDRNQTLAARSPDFREGVRAFLEKRPPRFGDA